MSRRRAVVDVGCLPLIVTILVMWALFFGVTINGKWHGIQCSASRGVEFK